MKFKVLTSDWVTALALVSSITPSSVDSKGSSGYLCVVRGDKCYLYSEDGHQRFRVPIPVFDVEGEGAFVFPTGRQGDLRYVEGWVEFEAVEEGGAHVVWCRRDPGDTRRGGVHKIITFSPQALRSLDADLGKAVKSSVFPSVLLREALTMTRSYLADAKDSTAKPEHLNLQLFGPDAGEMGDGYMLGCSISKSAYFKSPELAGKPLFVYGPRVSLLLSFLSKSPGEVAVYHSQNATYFMNAAEQVLGWSNQDYAGVKFGFYDTVHDRHIFKIARASLEKELRYVRSTLASDRNKALVSYDHASGTLQISAGDPNGGLIASLPLAAMALVEGDEGCWGPGDLGKKEDVQFNVNLDWMIQLVEAAKHPRDVVLGVARVKGKSNQCLFRLIEDYSIDEQGKYVELPATNQKVFSCRAVRFIPSKQ